MCTGTGEMPSPDEIGQANVRYNRIDEYSPYQRIQYHGPNRNQRVVTYSPEQLKIMEALMGARQGAAGRIMQRFGGNLANLSYGGDWTLNQPFDDDPGTYDPDDPTGGSQDDGGNKRYATTGYRRVGGDTRTSPIGEDDVTGGISTGDIDSGMSYKDVDLAYDLGLDSVLGLNEERGRYEQAYMDRAMGLLDDKFSEDQSRLDQVLANRGMPIGSEETEILQKRLGRERVDARTKAALDSVLYAGSEVRADRQQTLSERLAQYGTQAQTRGMLFGEDRAEYSDLMSILGMDPSGGAGGSLTPGSADMTQAFNMYQQGQMFNAQQSSDFWGGLLGLGGSLGAAALLCDNNFKHNFEPIDDNEILEKISQIPISRWNYTFDERGEQKRIGPMAQDFNAAFSTPVAGVGFESIDVVSVIGVLMSSVKALKARVEELEGGTS